MKANAHSKGRGPSRASNHQVIFELKNRVVIALNKLADRDTLQIGVEELEKIIACLTPDGVAPFLSCILDTDSEQKSAVRKECIRLTGVLAAFHEDHIGSHVGKIVASVVKRLKDPDSVVRDACVETMGVLASKLNTSEDESAGVFVALVKPLFEVLAEQNKQVQSGAALCLARVIDNTNDPPTSILQKMLIRTVKLLKNQHFMAKPAVIELNRSIIQGGGAPNQSALSAAMTSIQDALKNSDWTTRKAASAALAELASSGGSYCDSFKSSCICSLESCRFDKVKPVRDTVLHALHLWRSIIGPETTEPSETGSSIKENFRGVGYANSSSASDSTFKDVKFTKLGNDSVKRRSPRSLRKVGQKNAEYSESYRENDWQIEIAVPKTPHQTYLPDVHNEESEGSSVTKTFERTSTDITSAQYIGYEYVTMDDKQECSSVSSLVTDNLETKLVPVSRNGLMTGALVKTTGTSQRYADKDISNEQQSYFIKRRERGSLDSTVTTSSSQTMNACCLQTETEMIAIRKQLLEIESKQSDLLDLLKVFTNNTMESLSMIQLKVSGLEDVVEKMAQQVVHNGTYSDLSSSKLVKKSSAVASPRLSLCTPRPSVDTSHRQPLLPKKSNESWEEKTFSRGKLSGSAKQGVDMWKDSIVKESRNPVGKAIQKPTCQGTHVSQTRKTDALSTRARYTSEVKNSLWKLVKDHLSKGDLDSAYTEALDSGDELVLIELLDKTGPVLDSLSQKTANDVLGTLASYFREQRFMNSMIPWLQQIVDLCTIHGPNCLVISAKARREFLYAIQEAVNVEFSNSAERRSVTQLVMKLHQIWGKCS